jgi:hypothetical protein
MKEWLEELLDNFEKNPPDTTPERMKENRSMGKVGKLFYARKEQTVPSKAQKKKGELDALLYDYYHYFDTGYFCPMKPEQLTQAIKIKIKEMLDVL